MVDQGWSHLGSRVPDPLRILDPSRSWTHPDLGHLQMSRPLDHPTRPLWLSTTLLHSLRSLLHSMPASTRLAILRVWLVRAVAHH